MRSNYNSLQFRDNLIQFAALAVTVHYTPLRYLAMAQDQRTMLSFTKFTNRLPGIVLGVVVCIILTLLLWNDLKAQPQTSVRAAVRMGASL